MGRSFKGRGIIKFIGFVVEFALTGGDSRAFFAPRNPTKIFKLCPVFAALEDPKFVLEEKSTVLVWLRKRAALVVT